MIIILMTPIAEAAVAPAPAVIPAPVSIPVNPTTQIYNPSAVTTANIPVTTPNPILINNAIPIAGQSGQAGATFVNSSSGGITTVPGNELNHYVNNPTSTPPVFSGNSPLFSGPNGELPQKPSELGVPVTPYRPTQHQVHLDVMLTNPVWVSNFILIQSPTLTQNWISDKPFINVMGNPLLPAPPLFPILLRPFLPANPPAQQPAAPVGGTPLWNLPIQIIQWITTIAAQIPPAPDPNLNPVIPPNPGPIVQPPPANLNPPQVPVPADPPAQAPGPKNLPVPKPFQPRPVVVISPSSIGPLALQLWNATHPNQPYDTILDLPQPFRNEYRDLALWILMWRLFMKGFSPQLPPGYWSKIYGSTLENFPGNLPAILQGLGLNPNNWL